MAPLTGLRLVATSSVGLVKNSELSGPGIADIAAQPVSAKSDIPALDRKPVAVTADTGYFSEAALTREEFKEVDLVVPPDKQKHGMVSLRNPAVEPPVIGPKTLPETMRERLRSPEGHAIYKLRKQIVEPVFGQIKDARRIRAFLLRGLGKVQAEWQLICATHNLLKLFRAGLAATACR